jgi:hypothetical protein
MCRTLSHIATLLSTNKSIALQAGSTLESSRRCCGDVHQRVDTVYSLASDIELILRRDRP